MDFSLLSNPIKNNHLICNSRSTVNPLTYTDESNLFNAFKNNDLYAIVNLLWIH